MGKLVVIPARPGPPNRINSREKAPPRDPESSYIDGQRLLVEAIRYLVREDPLGNREAVGILSEHFRTQFRMSDRPHKD